ncbi:MAG: hypothetical protein LWX07_00500 [Bacteroidetes bacterium]|nr:hypothetical protein [Bacteroidota bacterium]
MKVLIISTNAFGDTYLSSSAIKIIRDILPGSVIDLLTIQDCSFFTEYLGFDNVFFIEKRGARELLKTRKFLGERKYNFVFSFFPGRMNSLLVMQSVSPNKYYYKNILKLEDWSGASQHVYYNSQKTDKVWEPSMNYLLRIKLLLDLAFGNDNSLAKPVFSFNPNLRNNIPGEVLINYSSKEENRRIGLKLVNELSEYISKVFNRQVCLLDFEGDFSEKPDYIVFPESYNFRETMSRIVSSGMFISVDSFLLHPAEAYGVNLLGIFGPTNPGSVLSSGSRNFIRVNPLKSLTLEDVVPYVRKLLGEE